MRLRGSNPRRVHLTAGGWGTTPPREHPREATMPSPTRFDGVPVKDPTLAALLTAAEQQGFRVEQAQNGNGHSRLTGLVVYPPDTAHAPIRFGVGRSTPRHTANVRSQLRLAGFIDPDHPATTPTTEESDMARSPRKTDTKHDHRSNLQQTLDAVPEAERPQMVGHLMAAAVTAIGGPGSLGALAGVICETLAEYAVDPRIAEQVAAEHGGAAQKQVDEALALAADAEERATRAEAALAKAEAAAQQARSDCGEALARARAAEARAESLDAALRPLRAILAGSGE